MCLVSGITPSAEDDEAQIIIIWVKGDIAMYVSVE